AWPRWRDTAVAERAAHLRRFARAMEADRERLATVIAREIGKPLWEARTEVGAMIGKVDITLGQGLDEIAEREFSLPGDQVARWRHHARGVAAVLGPFNFPGHLVNGHVVPALATGNTVVIKPSERAPAVGQLYAELADRAGFPPGVFNLVQGDGHSGGTLAAHPGVDAVLFTGSYAVGRSILAATLDQPHKLVALEMGGKNAVVVCDDADVDAAASAIAFGACATAGQRCSATSRVFALPGVAEHLTERLAFLFRELAVGDPFDEAVFMGPLISAAARARHAQVLEWARAEGAERLVDGGPVEGPHAGHYVRPSLHRVPALRADSRYQTEEHFVPDVHVLAVDSLEEGIAALNATEYGLVGSVFSRTRETFEAVARESRLGLLNWNASTVGANSKLPFGGMKQSGNDRPAGVTSTLYCTVPVASVEVEAPSTGPPWPGFPS
ncbi:MAG: aldehyde dehydrogenase family protein, partial [Proteobacteria bacterium]|nr:aldehyde dehydrogenase family protein [Pseudomonadota bacterium]